MSQLAMKQQEVLMTPAERLSTFLKKSFGNYHVVMTSDVEAAMYRRERGAGRGGAATLLYQAGAD